MPPNIGKLLCPKEEWYGSWVPPCLLCVFYMCFYIILALSHIQDCFSVRNYMCGNIRTRQRLTLFQALGDTGWGAADAGYPLLQSKIAGCKIDHECKVLKKEIIAQPTSVSFSRRIYNIHFMNYMKTYQYTCIYVRIYIGSLFIVSCFIGRIRSELEGGVAISFWWTGPERLGGRSPGTSGVL